MFFFRGTVEYTEKEHYQYVHVAGYAGNAIGGNWALVDNQLRPADKIGSANIRTLATDMDDSLPGYLLRLVDTKLASLVLRNEKQNIHVCDTW